MQAAVVRVIAAVAAVLVAFVVAVVALNASVYSPAGFVRTYVDALARQDPSAALRLAGPLPSSSAIDDLLTEEVMAELEIIDVVETGQLGARHLVEVTYRADGAPGRTEFEVESTGSILGFFTQWAFARSPLVRVDLQVRHAQEFTANGVRLLAPEANAERTYLAFTPGSIAFAHESQLLRAPARTIVFGAPARPISLSIDALPNEDFVSMIRTESRGYLDECARQQVLYPVGCPFGQVIADRLAGAPSWSILEYPGVELIPTATLGEWSVPVTGGLAQLDVEVRSIYDGQVTTLSESVPFQLGFIVTMVEEEIILTPRLG